jgi:hypothetical protein
MTAFTRNPSNPNFLHPHKFQLNFARVPNVQYFCQSVSVPGISTGEIPRNNPFVDLYSPGEKLIYDVMNITFYVDEELKAWLEIHDWLRAMTFPTDFTEYQNLNNLNNYTRYANSDRPQFAEGSLTILSSSNKPYYKFKFIDMFPVSLSSFVVATSDSPDTIITADATFRFAYYNVEKLF